MPPDRFENTVETFKLRTPWRSRVRIWLRWWSIKGFLGLAWRLRRWNLFRWGLDVRTVRAAEREYLRDLEHACFYGPEYDQ
jgi:hypothetical protein